MRLDIALDRAPAQCLVSCRRTGTEGSRLDECRCASPCLRVHPPYGYPAQLCRGALGYNLALARSKSILVHQLGSETLLAHLQNALGPIPLDGHAKENTRIPQVVSLEPGCEVLLDADYIRLSLRSNQDVVHIHQNVYSLLTTPSPMCSPASAADGHHSSRLELHSSQLLSHCLTGPQL